LKVGFFSGSFDPIHFGHLHLALQLKEIEGLDQVIFSPVARSPFKQNNTVASGQERYEMVRLAIEEIEGFTVTDFEILKEAPSYTIDAISHFSRSSPNEYHLLMSDEAALHFFEWKEARKLFKMAPPLIGKRSLYSTKEEIPKDLLSGVRDILVMEISSTDIRKRFFEKKYCGHLVPSKVLKYIQTRGLYKA
jgi:nicotinate-nucleotide adenylyltransferase